MKAVQGSYAITIPNGNAVILNKNWMFQHTHKKNISRPDYKDLLEIFFKSFQSLFKDSLKKHFFVRNFDADFLLPQ